MYLLGHTDPRFTMRVYEQVFDAGPQTVAQLETVLGCRSRRPSRSIQRGRFPDWKPDSARKPPLTRLTPGLGQAPGRFVERYAAKRLMGFEPTTFCMASRRSSQLSYSRALAGG